MRWSICFLPAVGADHRGRPGPSVLGLLSTSVRRRGLFAGSFALTALPVLCPGAFIWTDFWTPATRSIPTEHAKKRLEILKDPHVGAFAVIGGLVWFTLQLGVWSEAQNRTIVPLCITFALSRSLRHLALVFSQSKKRRYAPPGDGPCREKLPPPPWPQCPSCLPPR